MIQEDERVPLLAASSGDLSDPQKLPKRVRNSILGAVWIGVFLGALDLTLVSTLIGDVSSSFHKSNQSSWLGTSYLLSTATFTPLYGRLGDIIGRRWATLLAITLFTIGTALCAFAPSLSALIAGRMVAGMGGGGLMSMSSIIASDLVPLKSRALFQGLANLFFGAGAGLGGPLGGLIADSLGWRWAFIFQLPPLMVAFCCVLKFVRYNIPGQGKTKREMICRIDWGGSLSLIISLGSLLFALSFKNNDSLPWSDPRVWGPLLIFGFFFVVFVAVEGLLASEPVMPLSILGQRNGICVSVVNFTLSSVAFSILYFFPMFFEVVKGQSASRAGAHLLPNSIAISLGSLFAGYYIRHTGHYKRLIIVTSALPIIAVSGMAFLTQETSNEFVLWAIVIPSGFGFSSVVTSVLIALIASVDRSQMATATGMTYLFRYIGQTVGVALSGSLLQSVLATQLHRRITGPGSEEIIQRIREVVTSIRDLPADQKAAAVASYQAGLKAVFLLNTGIAITCFLATLPIKNHPLPDSFAAEEVHRREREETEAERRRIEA